MHLKETKSQIVLTGARTTGVVPCLATPCAAVDLAKMGPIDFSALVNGNAPGCEAAVRLDFYHSWMNPRMPAKGVFS
jgi:hypothetical protein